MIYQYLPPLRTAALLTSVALFLRLAVFLGYLAHEERYCQSDSLDYHVTTWCLAHGYGMHRPDTGRPIFWRTPGYPLYLAPFYAAYNTPETTQFHDYHAAHRAALIVQCIITSATPIITYMLALSITTIPGVALLCSWATALHPGFILASGYLLTDGLAAILFLLFLLLYLSGFALWFEKSGSPQIVQIVCAAIPLALYTWMRPMGIFVALGSTIFLCASRGEWRTKLRTAGGFFLLFALLVAPWFVRNYLLTHALFFCPLFGLYLNVFNAPKILARIAGISLDHAHKQLTYDAGVLTAHAWREMERTGSTIIPVGEQICFKTAWPLIVNHPWFFFYDWTVEVLKTTFDLYSYQLLALATNIFKWDPLVEYLPEKIAATLWYTPIPVLFRAIGWLELFWILFLWSGIILGFWQSVIRAVCTKKIENPHATALWIKGLFFIALVVGQTGGFGYARLRLPIEPLMSILGCMGWYLTLWNHETSLRSMGEHPHTPHIRAE
jgi:hypothetical protein